MAATRRSPIRPALMDIHFVHEAMEEPLVRGFLAKLEREEIIPTVPPVPGVVLEDYFQLIERRFSNPKIGDTMRRLCLDGSNRQPKFILPADRRPARRPAEGVTGLALDSALWCRYCFGATDSGKPRSRPTIPTGTGCRRRRCAAKRPARLAGHGGHLRRGRQARKRSPSRLRRPSGGLVAERRP